ncbi:MAG: LysM peptidoglycan-binding domain-containing protein [Verrucomicrobia bacterium]|nr:LysM peptidoglycan-binding domain-containing protein [Verrucomicrobiota bacterium]
MKSPAANCLVATILAALANCHGFAQTMAPTPNQAVSQSAQLQELTKKIDEQNAKIDMLSQQILKLELEITNHRPGVMIGEGTPMPSTSNTTSTSTAPPEASAKADNGNSHVVARGETLTSIAKMHGVSVSELQKYNHIDNPLKLQAGQTLLIPPSPVPSPSSSGE